MSDLCYSYNCGAVATTRAIGPGNVADNLYCDEHAVEFRDSCHRGGQHGYTEPLVGTEVSRG